MLYQKFSLKGFMTICYFIFFIFLNYFMTAEAGMVVGKICFYEQSAENGKKGAEGLTKIKEEPIGITTIDKGKIIKDQRYIIYCTIQKACNRKDCLSVGKVQLSRREPEKDQEFKSCYDYKIFMSPGKYHIICNQCKTEDVVINYGSLERNIDFYYYDNRCQDKPKK